VRSKRSVPSRSRRRHRRWSPTIISTIPIAFSFLSLFLSYQAYLISSQANSIAIQGNSIAVQANKIAYSAYNVVNNYPPYIDVSPGGLLILRLMNCRQSAGNVTCQLGGRFTANFTIIAPHLGLANVTSVALGGIGPFSRPASYQVFLPGGPELVRVGNATIVLNQAFQVVSSSRATVLASQPTKGSIEAVVAGLTVTMSLASLRNLDVTGLCTITAVITYWDIQNQSSLPHSLMLQAQIVLVPP
jgi:hypothetical protein